MQHLIYLRIQAWIRFIFFPPPLAGVYEDVADQVLIALFLLLLP